MRWITRATDIRTTAARAMKEKKPKNPKPNPNARYSPKVANGIDVPAAMKLPTAPAMNTDRFGTPRGRGWGGAGIAHPETMGGGYAPPGGAYGIPPPGCMRPRTGAAVLNGSENVRLPTSLGMS